MAQGWITLRCSICGEPFLHAAGSTLRPKTCGMLRCMVAAGESQPVTWDWAEGSD